MRKFLSPPTPPTQRTPRRKAWWRPLPPRLRLRSLPSHLGNVPHYRGGNWASIRKRALVRDGFRCRGCQRSAGQNGALLSVHHFEGYHFNGANTLENLITLCELCHPAFESYGAGAFQQLKPGVSGKPGAFQ